jgi:hypothetical protein
VMGGCEAFGTCGEPCESECTTDAECMDVKLLGTSLTECMRPACSDGKCIQQPADVTETCGPASQKNHCDGAGSCVCDTEEDCGEKSECQSWACSSTPKRCIVTNQATDLLMDPKGDCTKRSCSAGGDLIEEFDDKDPEVDDNECTKDACMSDGKTSHTIQVGQDCGMGPMCMGTSLKPQDTCQADGTCPSAIPMGCGLYACDSSPPASCKVSCDPAKGDTDCADAYCSGNTCMPKKGTGDGCMGGNQCLSASCQDAVCCENVCNTPCVSCDLGGGMPGKCSALPKGVKDSCMSNQLCNGSGKCEDPGGKAAVGQPCSMNSDCFNNYCKGGLCRLKLGTPCEQSYTSECEGILCQSNGTCGLCTDDSDCPSGVCHPTFNNCRLVAGSTCGFWAHCISGNCLNNVCQ